ncbi:MAG: TetR/AcrR family transcriptional regulator [Actinobacteria bacterium]|nr:TetR/AcrR family transcriptional regulator [Actinomycetota bacterium]
MAKPVAQRGFARERVIEAALALFAEHGVTGASLQMIADRLGVSKAAVYYQFQSKDEIALAVVGPVFDDIARLVRIAEALPSAAARRETAVSGLVELAVRHRKVSAVFYGDPTVERLLDGRAEFKDAGERFLALLLGPEPDAATRVAISLLTAGIHGCCSDPTLDDVDDAELRRALLGCCQRLLDGVGLAPREFGAHADAEHIR